MSRISINEGERIKITAIHGSIAFQNYLLVNGISLGSILTKNYSPRFAQLINFSIGGKMLSLRIHDFEMIEFVKI